MCGSRPLLIRLPGDTAAVKKVAVVVSANGKSDVFVEPLRSACQAILQEGRAVLAIDQRLRGEWAWTVTPPGKIPDLTWERRSLWGRPELGMAAHDIRSRDHPILPDERIVR